jgi:hypothetical protein
VERLVRERRLNDDTVTAPHGGERFSGVSRAAKITNVPAFTSQPRNECGLVLLAAPPHRFEPGVGNEVDGQLACAPPAFELRQVRAREMARE